MAGSCHLTQTLKYIERRYQSQSAGVHRKAFQPLASSVLITKLASRCRACISAWFWNSLWKEICYVCHTALVLLNVLKGIVHPKMEMMSLLTHPHVFQTWMTYFIFCEKYVCNAHNKINGVQFCFGTNWQKKKKRLYGQKQMKCCSKIIIFCVWQKKVSQTDLDQLSKTRSENIIKAIKRHLVTWNKIRII